MGLHAPRLVLLLAAAAVALLLAPAPAASHAPAPAEAAVGAAGDVTHAAVPVVAVLGSGGFLGTPLARQLRRVAGIRVVEVRDRQHVDLRVPGALAAAAAAAGVPRFDFIFFLAAEVGGAKFLESNSTAIQRAILSNNWALYDAVFNYAAATGARVLFTSSYLRHADHGAYAAMKRVGEEWAAVTPRARWVRLWNLYGAETPSVKSHVVSDWAAQCVRLHAIVSTTDAQERRQLLHIEDAAAALVAVYTHWDSIFVDDVAHHHDAAAHAPRSYLDVSSGTWLRLADVAARMSQEAVRLGLPPCPLRPRSHVAAPPRAEIDPDTSSMLFQAWHAHVPDPRAALAGTDGWDDDLAAEHEDGDGGAPTSYGYISLAAGLRQALRFHVARG